MPVQGGNPARPAINALTGQLFRINDAKSYVYVVVLSIEDNNMNTITVMNTDQKCLTRIKRTV